MPTYSITINEKVYSVTVPNLHERPIRAIVDGETIEVNVENDHPSPEISGSASIPSPHIDTKGSGVPQQSTTLINSSPSNAKSEIKSPLPGIIVSISVTEGDRVESGQELCVLEAMKMNNPIRSTTNGKVAQIFVAIGQHVQHGVPLMTIEE